MNEPFRSALRHTPDCPPFETLIGNTGAFKEHIRECSACQTELTMYRNFEAGEVDKDERSAVDFIVKRLHRTDEEVPGKMSAWRRFFTPGWMGGAALAVAAVLLAVGLTSQSRITTGRAVVADEGTLRTTTVTITSPTGEIAEAPYSIEWKPVEGAAEYSLILSEIDHNVIFHKNVTTSRIFLPDNVRTVVVPGKRILLEVTAQNGSGREIADSGTVSIRVKPAAAGSH